MTTKHFWHHLVFSSHRLWNWAPWKCHPSKKKKTNCTYKMHPHNLSLTKTHVMSVMFLLCSAHFTSSLQDVVSWWTFSASVFKAVIFRGPKFLKDPSPWEPHHSTSPLFRNSHTSVHSTWLHRRWGLAVGQALIKRTWGQTTTTSYHFLIHFPLDIIHCILRGKKKGRKWTQTHQFSLGKTDINEYWT